MQIRMDLEDPAERARKRARKRAEEAFSQAWYDAFGELGSAHLGWVVEQLRPLRPRAPARPEQGPAPES